MDSQSSGAWTSDKVAHVRASQCTPLRVLPPRIRLSTHCARTVAMIGFSPCPPPAPPSDKVVGTVGGQGCTVGGGVISPSEMSDPPRAPTGSCP